MFQPQVIVGWNYLLIMKDGPALLMLKDILKKALKQFFFNLFYFIFFNILDITTSSHNSCLSDTSGSFHSVRNLSEQNDY